MVENSFEQLCRLASDQEWCWYLYCTTCGHTHFRYGFLELINGKKPGNDNWIVDKKKTNYYEELGEPPFSYTNEQKLAFYKIAVDASISKIASECKFPDWLGYLGLVITHLKTKKRAYRLDPDQESVLLTQKEFKQLSDTWAAQLIELLPPSSLARLELEELIDEDGLIRISHLEKCESAMKHS